MLMFDNFLSSLSPNITYIRCFSLGLLLTIVFCFSFFSEHRRHMATWLDFPSSIERFHGRVSNHQSLHSVLGTSPLPPYNLGLSRTLLLALEGTIYIFILQNNLESWSLSCISPSALLYTHVSLKERGELNARYRWIGWVWEITGQCSWLQENYPSF